ncbi:MAG: hypothetical protein ACLPKB_02205 [Xanthobacteraceae bacterium]
MALTHLIAQVLGLFCLVLGASLFRKKIFAEVVDDIIANRALMYLVGVISLGLGLMVVLTHNIWNAGLLPLVVTLIGWAMVLRGIFAMFVSHDTVARWSRSFKVKELSWLFGIIFLVIGGYLTYAGFTS